MDRRWAWLCVLPLLGWWLTGLHDLDEGFYGAVAAEMNRRGEWVTPFYNGEPWFEKPILLYWLMKPCLWLFGPEVGPRLPSVLATLGIYGLLFWFARRRLAAGAEVRAPLAAGTSLLMVAAGRMALTDPLLVLCLTAAVLTYLEAVLDDARWLLATGAALGFGVLAKGPVALILFLFPFGYLAWRRRMARGAVPWIGAWALLAGVVALWYGPAYAANGQLFVQKFLIEQNVGRFTGGDAAHTLGFASLPLYVPILFVGTFPWSLGWLRAWRERRDETGVRGALWAWAIGTFAFFSLSGAKLPHYILPCVPPLALLAGDALAREGKGLRLGAALCVFWGVVANGVFLWYYGASGQAEAHALIRRARAEGGTVAFYQLGRREQDRGTGTLRLRETSLPSLFLYLDATALDTDRLDEIERARPRWVFTRAGRLSPAQLGQRGWREAAGTGAYRLYETRFEDR